MALALSPTGHLILSASDDPPAVYLKNLHQDAVPLFLQPRASDAPVVVAAFHPERPSVFLLAFRDGTMAGYDATRIIRADDVATQDGEIAKLHDLHRPTTKTVVRNGIGIKQTSITAAAFVPGYKTRAVSVGSDGRCRLVDFAHCGMVIRTWNVRAPLTSVSILPIRSADNRGWKPDRASGRRVSPYLLGGPTSTDNVIAVGRVDGKIGLYDLLGLSCIQESASENAERIISLEWMKCPSPMPMILTATSTSHEQRSQMNTMIRPEGQKDAGVPGPSSQGRGPPLALKKITSATQPAVRKFTVHPDEIEDLNTVRHTPQTKTRQSPGFSPKANLPDLFSATSQPVVQKKPSSSNPKIRPRISSQTFVRTASTVGGDIRPDQPIPANTGEARIPSPINAKPVGSKQGPHSVQRKARKTPTRENVNARAENAPGQEAHPVGRGHARRHLHESLKRFARQKHWDPGNVLEREASWVTDSMQDKPLHTDGREIWLTSDSEVGSDNDKSMPQQPKTDVQDQKTYGAPAIFDGSTEDMFSAATHLSPDGAFSPSSTDLRRLFPRTSSLSPRRAGRKREQPFGGRSDPIRSGLREVATNTLAARRKSQAKSPWLRVQAGGDTPMTITANAMQPQGITSQPQVQSGCQQCARMGVIIDDLREDTLMLQAEIRRLRRLML